MDLGTAYLLGGGISAGGSLIGGLLGGRQSGHQFDASLLEAQRQFNLSNRQARNMFQASARMSREFAKHGVRWRAEDARKAGLDPLVAMGATTTGGATGMPVSPGGVPQGRGRDMSWIAKMGQNIADSILRSTTYKDQELMRKLELESAMLDNDWKQIRNMDALSGEIRQKTQAPVPVPDEYRQTIPGQQDIEPHVTITPDRVIPHYKGHSAGIHGMNNWIEEEPNERGQIYVYSALQKDIGESMESDSPTSIQRNIIKAGRYIKGLFGLHPYAPKYKKPGYKLKYDRKIGLYYWDPIRKRKPIDPNYKKYKNTMRKYYQ